MREWKLSPLTWLPAATLFVSAIASAAILLNTAWRLLGWGILFGSLALLCLWHFRLLSLLNSLKAIKPDAEGEWWGSLPRIFSDLEQENTSLREQAEKEDQLLRSILASLNVGILLLGPHRQIFTSNKAAQRLLGGSSPAFFKGSVSGLINDPESLSLLERAYEGETCSWCRSRSERILSFHATPLTIQIGANADDWRYVLLAIQDITQQEALEQTRQKFISNASHELKTPATSIKAAAENLMADGWVPPEGEGNIKIILRNVDRMTLLLNDISELSRIETGALALEPVPLAVETFLKDVINNSLPLAKHKSVGLELEIEPSIAPRRFIADPLRLNQLLENLLSNAIKFSPKNSHVLLSTRIEGHWIVFSVRDHGPGIAPKDASRIFERFYRTQASRGVPGTGLGLAIVKHLCRVMGGEVGFESIPNEATTFYVKLPWEEPKLQ